MDKAYLENYQAREQEYYQKFVEDKITNGKFDYETDKYPLDGRFIKLQHPITDTTHVGCNAEDLWNQVPFSGSTIIGIDPCSSEAFEQAYFKVSDLPEIIRFIKETGKIQIILQQPPVFYEGFDYLDPLFKELEPPFASGLSFLAIGTEKEFKRNRAAFFSLASLRFIPELSSSMSVMGSPFPSESLPYSFEQFSNIYVFMKMRYPDIATQIEDSLIDNPQRSLMLMNTCSNFIVDPFRNIRYDSLTHSLEEIKLGQHSLGKTFNGQKAFPCEIGKFLLKKLTYAPTGLRACNEIIDNYNNYDLQKVYLSLNEAITNNRCDIIEKDSTDFVEILDNIWDDKTIPRRIQNIKVGLPFSVAAVGEFVTYSLGGGIGGFLAGLGFSLGTEVFKSYTGDVNEKVAKLFCKSHQINIYDFKKKYRANLTS